MQLKYLAADWPLKPLYRFLNSMRDNDERDRYLPDRKSEKDRLFVEIPAETKNPYPEKLPSGYDPIQSIRLEGRAFRGLAGGRIPWWVLITGWVIFGGLALLSLSLAIGSGFSARSPLLLLNGIPIAILWRGTAAKLLAERHKKKIR
jgi:hypothetical protein